MKNVVNNLQIAAKKRNLVIHSTNKNLFIFFSLVNCDSGFEMGDDGRCRGMFSFKKIKVIFVSL